MANPNPNPNLPGGGASPFDMSKFFRPPNSNPQMTTATAQQSQNPCPLPSAPYSYPAQAPPFHYQQYQQPQYYQTPFTQEPLSGLHHQRSLSFPAPSLSPFPSPNSNANQKANPSPNANHGARLMALLGSPQASSNQDFPPHQSPAFSPPITPSSSGALDFSMPLPHNANPVLSQPGVVRVPSSKLPKGRHLVGEKIVYNVDVRLQGEVQPQLEVTPITKYMSDPQLFVGRQIAVNKTYICYGLKQGNIRVLNINTALRSLLRGHDQRVTDTAFFAEDVHLLASASADRRFIVWKISEGPDEEDKPQITGNVVTAIQIVGEGDAVHPRLCWHCHKQEVLVIGVGKSILRIDTTKVGKGRVFSAEEPIRCPVDDVVDGIQFVGRHDGEVTDLSMCQWMTTRLVSASMDGTIKIWEDRKAQPLLVLKPHGGEPVYSAAFLTAPQRPDHIVLITGGPLNREVKVWASSGDEGWLLPTSDEAWRCTQTLELKSSAESRVEDAFFNQVVALSQAGLLLLANAKKNAIYAVHLEYGPNPATTFMDYIAEFTVTMPILSFTGTSDILPHGEHIVQIYCFQTQAIQQYALNLSQCLPPPLDKVELEKSESSISGEEMGAEGLSRLGSSGSKVSEVPIASQAPPGIQGSVLASEGPPVQDISNSNKDPKAGTLRPPTNNIDTVCSVSPPLPLSPRLSRKLSGSRSPKGSSINDPSGEQSVTDYSVDRQMDAVHSKLSGVASMDVGYKPEETKVMQDDISSVLSPPITFKHPTHLVTPSEILLGASSTDSTSTSIAGSRGEGETSVQDVVVNSEVRNVEVEVKVVGEAGSIQCDDGSKGEFQNHVAENKDKVFCSEASDLGIEMARECCTISTENNILEEAQQADGPHVIDTQNQLPVEGEAHDSANDVSGKSPEPFTPSTVPQSPVPTGKGKKQKAKNSQALGPSLPPPSGSNSIGSCSESVVSPVLPSLESAFPQILAMQEMLNQLMTMQKEMQKHIAVVAAATVTKESKRLEAALGRSMEKALKANTDALWAHFQEENVKHEKLIRDRTQQLTNSIGNLNKDLPAMLEKAVKKEVAAVGPAVVRTITPPIEKSISSAIVESFQRGVGDKAVNQLEKSVSSKLEATIARQIQAQFQTAGKQALQDALRSNFEATLIPAFEKSCKAMFEQVDAAFQKGMIEHTAAAQKHFDSIHSPLALALRESINSASSMTRTLSGELADGQRKLLALAAAGGHSATALPLGTQLTNGPLGGLHDKIEAPLDPTKELSKLIGERKYEEAFTAALQRSDVSIVSWLCSQVNIQGILSMLPVPLSQGVLLSLLQQLACDIQKETLCKLQWMTQVTIAINPADPMISMHVRPIFDQVYQIISHHRSLSTTTAEEASCARLLMHVINSMLMSSK